MTIPPQAWRIVAAQLLKRAEASARAAAHYRRGLLTSALAHWRVLHLRHGMQAMWGRALQVQSLLAFQGWCRQGDDELYNGCTGTVIA